MHMTKQQIMQTEKTEYAWHTNSRGHLTDVCQCKLRKVAHLLMQLEYDSRLFTVSM